MAAGSLAPPSIIYLLRRGLYELPIIWGSVYVSSPHESKEQMIRELVVHIHASFWGYIQKRGRWSGERQ
jgi:hypothetical protein